MHKSSAEDCQRLLAFLRESVSRGNAGLNACTPRGDVTCLMYFFGNAKYVEESWWKSEGALLETWRHCGMLRSVIVTNERHPVLLSFAKRYLNVSVQIEPLLVPGDLDTMSVDCISRLFERFDTKYVLIVQEDGFPLRSGLDAFTDSGYDFFGAPDCRADVIPDLLTRLLNYCPSNGGFSLRTKRMCRLAANLWHDRYEGLSFDPDVMCEDAFYTKTLPLAGLKYWFSRRQAPSILSDRFSYGAVFPLTAKMMPFGFHSASGFAAVARRFGIP